MIILVNVVIFFAVQPQLSETLYVSPAKFIALVSANPFDLRPWLSLFMTMWLHGSVAHLATNMWFLYIFGDNVEDDLGFAYIPFYLAAGIVSALVHIAVNPTSTTYFVGASGAISGVMGLYLVLHPRARIATLVWVIFYITVIAVPAWVWLLVWFALGNLLPAMTETMSYVAYWAHIGGFVFGLLLGLMVRPNINKSMYDCYW